MATPVKRAALDEILVRRGLISQDQAEDFRSQANGADRSFRGLLLEHTVVAEEALAEIVAEQYGLRYDPLKDFRVDLEFFKTIPVELMPCSRKSRSDAPRMRSRAPLPRRSPFGPFSNPVTP